MIAGRVQRGRYTFGNSLPAEGVILGHGFHGDRVRFNPHTFIVYVGGGFNLEGVAFTRSANINGLVIGEAGKAALLEKQGKPLVFSQGMKGQNLSFIISSIRLFFKKNPIER